jgi:hypothetical protein
MPEKDYYKIYQLMEIEKKTTDPFELIKIRKKISELYNILMKISSNEKRNKNANKFLNKIKKLNKKCILIVTHGDELINFLKIITNTYDNAKIVDKNQEINKYYGHSNCCIMGCLLDEGQIKLVIPPNNLHLKTLAEKNPEFYPIKYQ